MNKSKLLLRLAGGLTLFTFLGHTAGTFMPIPAEQVEVARGLAVMKATPVPMPVGRAQNFADIFRGTNLTVSLYLLITGIAFFLLSGADKKRLLLLNSLGLACAAAISAVYFFPLPAICTGLAAILGLWAAKSG